MPHLAVMSNEDEMPARSTMPTLRPVQVSLAVRDLDGVAAFYRDVIGLQAVARDAGAVLLGAGGVGYLELLHRPSARPGDAAAAGLYHTAFLLPSRADLGRWLVHARQTGQALDGAADHLVSEAVYLHDPEGNGIEIYADRPAAEWRWTEAGGGRRVVMANQRLDMAGLMAGAGSAWTGAPDPTRIGHVHLRVGDAAAAQRFYGGLIGMDVTAAWPSAVFLSTDGYHHHIAANSWDSAGAGLRDPSQAGLHAVTFAGDAAALAGIAGRAGLDAMPHDGLADPWGTRLQFHLTESTP